MPGTVGIVASHMKPATANIWTYQAAAAGNPWRDVAWTGSKFISISTYGTPRIMTSTDGILWTGSSVLDSATSDGCIYVNSLDYVFVATAGSIYRSLDNGDSWTQTGSGMMFENPRQFVSSDDGSIMYLLASDLGSIGVLFRSSDYGLTWTQDSSYPTIYGSALATNGQILVDSDLNWRNIAADSPWNPPSFSGPSALYFNSIHYANGKFVAVGYDQYVCTSSDGKNWVRATAIAPGDAGGWTDVAYGKGLWVAAASGGNIMVSENGVSWKQPSTTESPTFEAIAYGGGKFVAVASSGVNQVILSDDDNIPIVAFNGGKVETKNNYRVHRFTQTGSSTLYAINAGSVNALVVAGGGGGGYSGQENGAGGGAGGVRTSTLSIPSNQTVTVGSGGAAGTVSTRGGNGTNSSIGSLLVSTGGGGGGTSDKDGTLRSGSNGGSGGGAAGPGTYSGGSGISGEGNNGGNNSATSPGAGGGGASQVGASITSNSSVGSGGNGVSISIAGATESFGGGGGGGRDSGAYALGGLGGGGGGATSIFQASPGSPNTGGGGGGGYDAGRLPKSGGSGVVIVWYEI